MGIPAFVFGNGSGNEPPAAAAAGTAGLALAPLTPGFACVFAAAFGEAALDAAPLPPEACELLDLACDPFCEFARGAPFAAPEAPGV